MSPTLVDLTFRQVVEKMIERSMPHECLNPKVVSKEILMRLQCSNTGCFEWMNSNEGHHFWNQVIMRRNFDLFFQKYPKPVNRYLLLGF